MASLRTPSGLCITATTAELQGLRQHPSRQEQRKELLLVPAPVPYNQAGSVLPGLSRSRLQSVPTPLAPSVPVCTDMGAAAQGVHTAVLHAFLGRSASVCSGVPLGAQHPSYVWPGSRGQSDHMHFCSSVDSGLPLDLCGSRRKQCLVPKPRGRGGHSSWHGQAGAMGFYTDWLVHLLSTRLL